MHIFRKFASRLFCAAVFVFYVNSSIAQQTVYYQNFENGLNQGESANGMDFYPISGIAAQFGIYAFGKWTGYADSKKYDFYIPLNLTNVTQASLIMALWCQTEVGYDIFTVSGTNSRNQSAVFYSNSGFNYTHPVIDLSSFDGSQVVLKFELTSDASQTYTGVEFDNILVTGNIAPVPEPETYAMLLSGMGVIAFLRRRKSLYKI